MKTALWIIAIVFAVGAVALLIGMGRQPSVSEATADFCTDLNDYTRALLDLRAIDENSTVDDLRAAGAEVEDSLQAVQSSAATLQDARLEAVVASQQALQDTITAMPGDMTLAQAGAELRLATLNALADATDVMTTDCQISLPPGATTLRQR